METILFGWRLKCFVNFNDCFVRFVEKRLLSIWKKFYNRKEEDGLNLQFADLVKMYFSRQRREQLKNFQNNNQKKRRKI